MYYNLTQYLALEASNYLYFVHLLFPLINLNYMLFEIKTLLFQNGCANKLKETFLDRTIYESTVLRLLLVQFYVNF